MINKQWAIDQALRSYASLMRCLDLLTEEEVLACLQLEASSRRRQSLIDRLIARAVRLRELSYRTQLQERYHGTSKACRNPASTESGSQEEGDSSSPSRTGDA
jgi:hypothetical protein